MLNETLKRMEIKDQYGAKRDQRKHSKETNSPIPFDEHQLGDQDLDGATNGLMHGGNIQFNISNLKFSDKWGSGKARDQNRSSQEGKDSKAADLVSTKVISPEIEVAKKASNEFFESNIKAREKLHQSQEHGEELQSILEHDRIEQESEVTQAPNRRSSIGVLSTQEQSLVVTMDGRKNQAQTNKVDDYDGRDPTSSDQITNKNVMENQKIVEYTKKKNS